ncbi:cytochrome c [Bacillus sp. FJAT-29790]|uniref:cytochrome c550 n=1 Tax=Bacillus sp. FJAT-29790 TaxID=1895002 RepID=UPI001C21A5A8|nr:cytochrome c [Bacillus sp. FJAT-29790]MBU8879417.1 cytochrome c [Bacillus sp. FJAT-29790]
MKNPIMPYILIFVFGIAAMFLISFKGLGDMEKLAIEAEGGGKTEETATAATPEEIYAKSCIACHGDQHQGGIGPALTGVGDHLSADEISDILVNGKGAMPPGLVPADKAGEMAAWLAELK